MKKVLLYSIVIILLANCVKKNNTITDEKSVYNINNGLGLQIGKSIESGESLEQSIKYSIKDISDFIFNDLKLKWDYNNFEEVLSSLNIPEYYTLEKQRFENPYGGINDYIDLYTIKWDQYKYLIRHSSTNIKIYFMNFIEIELNDNNYLQLFPYKNIEEYISDNNFGIRSLFMNPIEKQIEDGVLSYDVYREPTSENPESICRLYFNNGVLKSFRIDQF